MKKQFWLFIGLIVFALACLTDCKATGRSEASNQAASQSAQTDAKSDAKAGELSFGDYQSILNDFVHNGRVNYAALRADTKATAKLRRFIDQLAKNDLSKLESKDDKTAFWINAYNALVMEGALRRFPVETLRPSRPKGAYDDSFYAAKSFVVAGEKVSLKDIEARLKKETFDPRVHFALACGAISSAPLSKKVYTAAGIEDELDAATKEFLKQPGNFSFDKAASRLKLSQLFEWYKQEFEDDAGGTVVEWTLDLLDPDVAKQVKNVKPRDVSYLPFDWKLNNAS